MGNSVLNIYIYRHLYMKDNVKRILGDSPREKSLSQIFFALDLS